MRTVFFTSLLVASAAATSLLEHESRHLYDDTMSLGQTESSSNWLSDADIDEELLMLAQVQAGKVTNDTGTQWINQTGYVRTTFELP